MKKNILLFFGVGLLFVLVLFLIFGNKNEYAFSQPHENIESIEIIQVGSPFHMLSTDELCSYKASVTITSEKTEPFIKSFHDNVTLKKYWNDPYQAMEGSIIRIQYKNGCVEFISKRVVLYQKEDGRWIYTMDYFDDAEFDAFIESMINENA